MSIQAVGWVLDNSEAVGNDRLVMISLANHADELRVCWPSVSTICREACVSRATTFRCLDRLRDQGEIARVTVNELTPTQQVRFAKIPVNYQPNIYRLQGSQSETAGNSGVSISSPRGLTNADSGVSLVTPEPSIEPSVIREKFSTGKVNHLQRRVAKNHATRIRDNLRSGTRDPVPEPEETT